MLRVLFIFFTETIRISLAPSLPEAVKDDKSNKKGSSLFMRKCIGYILGQTVFMCSAYLSMNVPVLKRVISKPPRRLVASFKEDTFTS